MRKVSFRHAVVAGLTMTTLVTNTACFASFPLTRKLYNFNKSFSSDKWMQELFFLATGVILPVYGVAGLIDMVILNSMEFWTGKPALQSSSVPETKTKVMTVGNTTVTQTMTRSAEGKMMTLEEKVDGTFTRRTTLTQQVGVAMVTAQTTYADGRSETRSLTVDQAGKFTLKNPTGGVRTLTASEVDVLSARMQQLQESTSRAFGAR